jgi:hypothetical protein
MKNESPYSDIDVSPPELNCDACRRELKGKNSEPSDCIVPSNCKATVMLISARVWDEKRDSIQ